MDWIVVLLAGAVIGWLASLVMGSSLGLIGDILVGLVGASIGRFISGLFLGVAYGTSFSVGGLLFGVIGACVLIAIVRALTGAGRNRPHTI